LAHPLGLCCGLPHGVLCAALMPPVLERNAPAAPGKYDVLRSLMGDDPAQVLRELLDRMGLPRSLGEYPDEAWEQDIIAYAVSSGSGKANPVPMDETYVRAVLSEVCSTQ
ncbi:MAG: maleylacetate reductase, partial [Planctomycetota bacterium]